MLSAEKHRDIYNNLEVVQSYVRTAVGLQKAEATILEELGTRLGQWDVLDIGVGTGRTSEYLIPRVKNYVGLDYAERMVEACRQRFPETERVRFALADARDLQGSARIRDASFDLVVFSFNGIDCVDEADRARVLSEVRRVLRPGGLFCFSAHNLNFDLRGRHSPSLAGGPRGFLGSVRRWARFRLRNRGFGAILARGCGLVLDGTEDFRVPMYYTRARPQLEDLARAGFARARIFGSHSGRELSPAEAEISREAWLYYLTARN